MLVGWANVIISFETIVDAWQTKGGCYPKSKQPPF